MNGLDTTQLLALAAALGWASGLRLYAVLLITGGAGWLGWVELPPGLQPLQQPLVLGASALLAAVEFTADKIPVVDSIWDGLQTLLRIPAGAALAAAALGADSATGALLAALLGGTLAASAHAAKATARAAANTSPEPFSNLALSLAGDAAVPALLWLAWQHPVAALVTTALAALACVVIVAVLWRFLRALVARLLPRPRAS
ncbi:hypothetical protein CKO44_11625 [Rubrivivax gelatinosus]|uniref:DUF4126 domain-containing protein n=1 Tax=Rubrivivax gelatinosus TaxID=28068 RepID=A0ABS1DP95_RUBGE|nr:DUF4126 domain-containing protein [Rubrivivax gelatinosus]MBK1614117.1 hypothetical protein [Rubrivivax gelatinosus]MBK1711786.1 hypothetical protein [Rubrivivax gelatinosus]